MSGLKQVRDLLSGLPIRNRSTATIRKLDGGLNNQVFLIESEGGDFVLRLGHKPPGLPDVSIEMAILANASNAGLGPEIAFSDAEGGILLTEFLPGETWERENLLVRGNLEALAKLLRDLHALPRCGDELDVVGIAENHYRQLDRRDDLRQFGSTCLNIVNRCESAESITCCHNDVVAENIVAGDRLRLIDWEWAADNEPLFDLASIIAYHDLGSEQSDALLDAYTGGADVSARERLADQLRLFDALQWLWLAAREVDLPSEEQAARLSTLQSRIST